MSEPEFLTNQRKINGRLCQVDWRLEVALKELIAALRATGSNEVHVNHAEHLVNEAFDISQTVAIPNPPGCDPFNPQDPPTN